MVLIAWFWREVWVLVLGGIIAAVIKMVLSHHSSLGEQRRLKWDKPCVSEIIHFGKWIFVSSILGFLLNQGDRILLGGLINADTLGIYTIAFFLAMATKDLLAKLSSTVFFPVLSETIRAHPQNTKKIYYKIRSRIDVIAMSSAGFLFSTGDELVKLLYDARYHPAGEYLQIMSLSLAASGYMLASQCFLASGKPKVETILISIQVLTLYVLLPVLFFRFGMIGAIWAITVNPLFRIVASLVLMKQTLFLNITREFMFTPAIIVGYVLGEILRSTIL